MCCGVSNACCDVPTLVARADEMIEQAEPATSGSGTHVRFCPHADKPVAQLNAAFGGKADIGQRLRRNPSPPEWPFIIADWGARCTRPTNDPTIKEIQSD